MKDAETCSRSFFLSQLYQFLKYGNYYGAGEERGGKLNHGTNGKTLCTVFLMSGNTEQRGMFVFSYKN